MENLCRIHDDIWWRIHFCTIFFKVCFCSCLWSSETIYILYKGNTKWKLLEPTVGSTFKLAANLKNFSCKTSMVMFTSVSIKPSFWGLLPPMGIATVCITWCGTPVHYPTIGHVSPPQLCMPGMPLKCPAHAQKLHKLNKLLKPLALSQEGKVASEV